MSTFQHIAIALENNSVTAVEIERDKTIRILTFGQYNSKINFDDLDSIFSQKDLMFEELKNFLISINSVAPNISFALNSHSVFLSTIPIDSNLKETEIQSVIQWELNHNLLNSTSTDYLISSHQLPSQTNVATHNYLLVGIKKSLIKFLDDIAVKLKKKMNIIEIDHFGAEHFLSSTNNKLNQKVSLIGADELSFDISILNNKICEAFSIFSISNPLCYEQITKFIIEAGVKQIFVHGRFANSVLTSPLKIF